MTAYSDYWSLAIFFAGSRKNFCDNLLVRYDPDKSEEEDPRHPLWPGFWRHTLSRHYKITRKIAEARALELGHEVSYFEVEKGPDSKRALVKRLFVPTIKDEMDRIADWAFSGDSRDFPVIGDIPEGIVGYKVWYRAGRPCAVKGQQFCLYLRKCPSADPRRHQDLFYIKTAVVV